METMAQRIQALIRDSGLSQRALAARIGVSSSSLSQWATGRFRPSDEAIATLCEFFSVTPAWLLYGDGNAPEAQSIVMSDTVAIPQLDVSGSCGFGDAVEEFVSLVRMIRVSLSFLRIYCPGANNHALHIITCRGDSMEPTLSDGDTVIVDVSQKHPTTEGVYAVVLNGSVFVKRLQFLQNGYRLLSDNKRYDAINVASYDDVKIIGKCYVSFAIKRL